MITLLWLALGCTPQPRFPDPAADLMARLDTDGSGTLTRDELRDELLPAVMALDTDEDGQISLSELDSRLSRFELRPPRGKRR